MGDTLEGVLMGQWDVGLVAVKGGASPLPMTLTLPSLAAVVLHSIPLG